MTDDEPPATRADLERLGVETADRAYALHGELLTVLMRRVDDLEQEIDTAVRDAVEHSLRVQRGEIRLLRHAVAAATGPGRCAAAPRPPGRWGGVAGARARAVAAMAVGGIVGAALMAVIVVLG